MSQNLSPPTKLRDDAAVAREKVVMIRLTDEEHRAWTVAATAEARKVSDFVRLVVNAHVKTRKRTADEEDELVQRAITAFRRSGGTEQPANTSHVDGDHVVLENVNGELARYRISAIGRLSSVEVPPPPATKPKRGR